MKQYHTPRGGQYYGRTQQIAGGLKANRIKQSLGNLGMEEYGGFVDPSSGSVDPALNDVLDYKYGTDYTAALKEQALALQTQNALNAQQQQQFMRGIAGANLGLRQQSNQRADENLRLDFEDDIGKFAKIAAGDLGYAKKTLALQYGLDPNLVNGLNRDGVVQAYRMARAGSSPNLAVDEDSGWNIPILNKKVGQQTKLVDELLPGASNPASKSAAAPNLVNKVVPADNSRAAAIREALKGL